MHGLGSRLGELLDDRPRQLRESDTLELQPGDGERRRRVPIRRPCVRSTTTFAEIEQDCDGPTRAVLSIAALSPAPERPRRESNSITCIDRLVLDISPVRSLM